MLNAKLKPLKVSQYSFRKNRYKKLSCMKSGKIVVEYSIGSAMGKGEIVAWANNRFTDLLYMHSF